jgi:hypothetical protein
MVQSKNAYTQYKAPCITYKVFEECIGASFQYSGNPKNFITKKSSVATYENRNIPWIRQEMG